MSLWPWGLGRHITVQHNDDIKGKRTEVAAYCTFTKIYLVSKPAATKKPFLLPSSDSTLTQTTLPLPASCVHSLSSGCKQRWVFITQTLSLVTQPDTWQWFSSSESRILDLMQFLCPCKALWLALCLNYAIQINVPWLGAHQSTICCWCYFRASVSDITIT